MILGIDKVILLLLRYRYFVLFPVAVFEGPIISVLAGFLVSQGVFSFLTVILVLVLGDIVGDSFYYGLGRYGGRRFVHRWGKYFGVTEENFLKTQGKFHDHATKILLFGKAQPLGSVILFAAGVVKVPYVKFLWWNFLGTVVKSIILVAVGYYFGQAYMVLDQYGTQFAIGMTLLAVVIVIIFIKWPWKKSSL